METSHDNLIISHVLTDEKIRRKYGLKKIVAYQIQNYVNDVSNTERTCLN